MKPYSLVGGYHCNGGKVIFTYKTAQCYSPKDRSVNDNYCEDIIPYIRKTFIVVVSVYGTRHTDALALLNPYIASLHYRNT